MKHIGATPNGSKIVEFTEKEYEHFIKAQIAMDGFTLEDDYRINGIVPIVQEQDMSQFFIAMRKFILARFKVNELKKFVDNLESTIVEKE